MSKKTINEALKMIGEGFIALSEAYTVSVDTTKGEDKTVSTTIDTAIDKVVSVEDVTPTEEVAEVKEEQVGEITQTTLEAMSYLDIKNKAKDLGLKAVGSKKSLIEAIIGVVSTTEANTPEEEVEAPTEAPEEIEEDTTDIVEDDEELELEEDEEEILEASKEADSHTLYDKVVADLEKYSNEELADILSEIGISPKGKRQALLAKIVQAVEEGKLEWEEEEVSEEPKETLEEVIEEDEEYTFKGTKTRLNVAEDYYDKIKTDFEDGTINDKTILKFLKSYYNDKYTSCGRQADFEEYARIQCELVDDDGELHSLAEPYFVADEVYCCGEVLKEVDQDLYCEYCGTTYENEE